MRRMALWPPGWLTSEAAEFDQEQISKIRACHDMGYDMRNGQGYKSKHLMKTMRNISRIH